MLDEVWRRIREESRDAWGWAALDRLEQDVRHAARALRHAPLYTLSASLILGAGIGLNLTFFHLLNVTALRAPAVKDPASLVRFTRESPHSFASGFPLPAVDVIRQHNDVLSAVLTRQRSDVVWAEDPAGRLNASFVSANWFTETGYQAALGRVFREEDDTRADSPLVTVLSHHFHRVRLHADPDVVGRQLRVNDRLVTVVGVAPPAFPDFDMDDPQLWLLIDQIDQLNPGTSVKEDWTSNETELYGRLKPGISPQAANDGLLPAVAALSAVQPKRFRPDQRLVPARAADGFRGPRELRQMKTTAGLIAALTLLVLAVTSANLTNFVLSRAMGRFRDFSIRAALGATRFRIVRQMLVECALIAAAGAFVGLVFAPVAARLIAVRLELPAYLDFSPDRTLLLAAAVVAIVAMLVVGLVPAWLVSKRDLAGAIKDGGQQATLSLARARARLTLVGAQVLGCCALLVIASAVFQNLKQRLESDPGFRVDRVTVLDPLLTRHGVSPERARGYWDDVRQILTAQPDIEASALAYPAPIGGGVMMAGYPEPAGLTATVYRVGPEFFGVLQIPLLGGRTFTPDEKDGIVIISRALALRVYGTLDIIGKRYPHESSSKVVAGVVGDAALEQRPGMSSGQQYEPLGADDFASAVLLARSRGEPGVILERLRQAARLADERVLAKTGMLSAAYDERFRGPRLARTISGFVAMLVLALACLGIAGVVAYAVKLRTKEIGIRRALGASSPRLCALLLRQLAVPVVVGVIGGTAVGLAATRQLAGDPFYLTGVGSGAAIGAILVFVLTGLAAALLPASQALSIDPVGALRHD